MNTRIILALVANLALAGAASGQLRIAFDTPAEAALAGTRTPGVVLALEADRAFVHEGAASLRIDVEDPGGGREIWPAVDVTLPEPVDLATVRAIECRVHVPAGLARNFFGRYDARFTVNGRKPLWSRPAIEPGWTHLRWELSNLHEFPEMRSLRLQLGPIMPGFGRATMHVDSLVLEPMEALGETDAVGWARLAQDRGAPWWRRLQAIRRLEDGGDATALPALFVAVADGGADEGFNPTAVDLQPAYINKPPTGSEAVRSAARRALLSITVRTVATERTAVERALAGAARADDGRMRLAAVATVAGLAPEAANARSLELLRRALLDDLYYVREQALAGLARCGVARGEVARQLGAIVANGASEERIAAARCLSEMGSPALPALPHLLAALRDPAADRLLRGWCLRAAWWTDESVLTPDDWVIALGLRPGQIHRHLLNRAMDRLEKAGPKAVPALARSLRSSDREERARAAVLLRKAGPAGEAALAPARSDPAWYVRAAAGVDVPAPMVSDVPVMVEETSDAFFFRNGAIEVVFDKHGQDPGPVAARLPGGPNLLDGAWLYRVLSFKDTKAQNIIERVWFQKIRGAPLNKEFRWRLGACSAEQAEMICTYPGGGAAPLEWEFHYLLRRGESGFHSFIVVRNTSGRDLPESTVTSSADAVGMFNQLVAPTWGLFDTAVQHDNFKWPARFNAEPDFAGYPDIYQATYRMPDGEVDAKHEGGNHELASPVVGFCGPQGGVWQITPSLEYSGGSWPWDQKTGVSHNLFVFSLENKYYVPTSVRIAAGWEKVYGPIFHYLNRGENTEEMWADAQRRAATEIVRWPQPWMTEGGFHERGTVQGRVSMADGASPEGAWALLALPGGDIPERIEFGHWWRDVGSYHYSTAVGPDGTFAIPHVRAGDYSLFIWREGVFGEFRRDGLRVEAGRTLDVGDCTLVPRTRGRLLWQIGEANRTVTEFRNGGNFHQWDTYLRYRDDFPNDVRFVVGRSNPARDWNYLQPAVVGGESKPTTWTIVFDLDTVPAGKPVLTVVAGGRGADLDVYINEAKIGELRIDEIGLQHIRTVPHGELTGHEFAFARTLLRPGRNTLELTFARPSGRTEEGAQWIYQSWTNYLAYDFLRLELAPPGGAGAAVTAP